MTEPSREHVAPVAQIIESHLGGQVAFDPHSWRCYDKERYPGKCRCPADLAFDILTSTDPAVLDAMQDALVRAGRLREEWTVEHSQGIHPGKFTERSARDWIANDIKADERRQRASRGRQRLLRRIVTEWQEVES